MCLEISSIPRVEKVREGEKRTYDSESFVIGGTEVRKCENARKVVRWTNAT